MSNNFEAGELYLLSLSETNPPWRLAMHFPELGFNEIRGEVTVVGRCVEAGNGDVLHLECVWGGDYALTLFVPMTCIKQAAHIVGQDMVIP